MYLKKILFSLKTTVILLSILAISAGVATFIENDFGTTSALFLVYNSFWYEALLVLTTINLIAVIYKFKMWKNTARFLFHSSFVVILIGAGITRYVGYEGIVQIPEGVTTNEMISLEPYLQVTVEKDNNIIAQEMYQEDFTSLFKSLNSFKHKIKVEDKILEVSYIDFMFAKKEQSSMGLLTVNINFDGKNEETRLAGLRGQLGVPKELMIGDYKVTLIYGSKYVELPFAIRLNEFQLDRYPGSMAPSSYASEVTVIKDDKAYDYRIFMNRTLSEGNFLFFQSSYFPDETGTVLSVNNDPGKWPTYLGYFLLTLGLLLNFFDKKSRFMKLVKYVSSKNIASFALVLTLFNYTNIYANDDIQTELEINKVELAVDYLNKYKDESKQVSEKFGNLVVQGNGGRMQPLSTLNKQIVQKLSGRSNFLGMDANQIVFGMLTRPDVWKDVKILKIQTQILNKNLLFFICIKTFKYR